MNVPKKTCVLNFRISSDLKDESRDVLSKYDLTHSKAIRLFLEYIIEYNSLPANMEEYIKASLNK